MAMSKSTINPIPETHIESVQTVTPLKITESRQAHRVSVASPAGFAIFRQCLHIILYHKKETEDDSRWYHVGWLRESLARALLEQPIFAGRFREADHDQGDYKTMEIVSNDSGIRVIEACIPITLSEFLDFRGREDGEEAKLVFWKDIDELNPQYSPLVYVQVTNFQCGGCSVGISCSILLADIFLKENFIERWAKIHTTLLPRDDLSAAPMYYLPNVKKSGGCSPTKIFTSSPSKKCGQTMIFNVTKSEIDDAVLQFCVEEAERKFGSKMVTNSSLFVKSTNSCNAIKVEAFPEDGLVKPKLGLGNSIVAATWDDFGANEVEFRIGNKPACVSYWIGFVSGGFVMAMPSADDLDNEVKVIVAVPNEKKFYK